MKTNCYIANARMYAASPLIAGLWEELFSRVEKLSGVSLCSTSHPWPADIEELWARPDLGLVFMCGKPFRNAGARHKPIAVPLTQNRPASDPSVPAYCTHFLIRDNTAWQILPDSFGCRLGWTVPHSHSGFNAVRYTLLPYCSGKRPYPLTIGPLHTPARCLQALLCNEADIVPMDSYYHTLLMQHSPERLAGTRVLASSPAAPMPFFVASPNTPDDVCQRLRDALCESGSHVLAADNLLNDLALDGFAPVNPDAYRVLDAWEAAADKAELYFDY